MNETLDLAAEALRRADSVALACHVNPDADALGSMLGLSNFLRARGVETVCSFGNDPFEPPRWLDLLPGADALVAPASFPKEPPVLVTLDCASIDRLGPLAGRVRKASTVIWIDHHVSNDGLGTIPLVSPAASSTAELVYGLIRRMGGEIPGGAAACLYAGLVTDTGRFQYEAVRPEVLRLAAELREFPFDHAKLARGLYEDNGIAYLRLLGSALGRMKHEPAVDMVWTYLTRADLADAGVHLAETDDLIDVVRTAREADVTVVLKQQRDGRFKVSMRSRGGHDLATIASANGGGGHRLAAGYTSDLGPADTIEALKRSLRGGA